MGFKNSRIETIIHFSFVKLVRKIMFVIFLENDHTIAYAFLRERNQTFTIQMYLHKKFDVD